MSNEVPALEKKLDDVHLHRHKLIQRFNKVRNFTTKLCWSLEVEDFVIQSMPDVSPTKWHLAHTTWFYEAFILNKALTDYKSIHPLYTYLFNSYYVQIGERWTRSQRGLLSRPTVKEIFEYRNYVDERVIQFIDNCDEDVLKEYSKVLEIGLNHEQQHQELLLTDIKHVLSINPINPVYSSAKLSGERTSTIEPIKWIQFEGGINEVGNDSSEFCFDNERPTHKVLLQQFKFANRLITNGEFIKFIEDGGYQNTPLWLSDGWAMIESQKTKAPLYWENRDDQWWNFTLNGFKPVNKSEPVCHVSYYEAEAFAAWNGARLPTEVEWETVSAGDKIEGNFVESENYHPQPLNDISKVNQLFGDVWEWTGSAYLPYPGFKPLPGELGEYNGKFMSGQMVLRGGACATSKSHIRKTYRNFFPPSSRWQFMGIRLANNI